MYWMTSLVENDNWEEIVGRCHAHGGTKFSIGLCIPGKYMNQGKLSGSSFHQKSLPYRPNHFSLTIYSRSHGLRPWVTKIIYDFARFLMSFFAGNMNIHHGFPYVSQGLFLKASKGHIKVLGPWCSSCYKSSSLAKILTACPLAWPSLGPLFFFFFLLLLFLSFSFFLGFRPSWSFLTSWIGPSFVKVHDLSLHFMEWAFLWNFGPNNGPYEHLKNSIVEGQSNSVARVSFNLISMKQVQLRINMA